MTSRSVSTPPLRANDTMDRLFSDCTELEASITAIRLRIDKLDQAINSGFVTAEHLLNLTYRIENAEHGLIAIADRVGDAATSLIDRRRATALVH